MLERHFSNKPQRNDRSAAGIAERESFSLKMQSKSKALDGLYFPILEFLFYALEGEKRQFEINFTIHAVFCRIY